MLETLRPETPQALAEALAAAARDGKRIRAGGAFSKDAFGGPIAPADIVLSTAALTRVLQYEPRDLTISVEAGMPWAELSRLLAQNRLMLPLDPPLAAASTVGGVVAANLSGPRRRMFGAARDLVIGMSFATLAGKLVETGGMVVKNVAGLDVSKLLIGSCGTLAVITSVNFRLHPIPASTRTFLNRFDSAQAAIDARDRLLRGVLQPLAVDLLTPGASGRLGRAGYVLAVEAGGSPAVLDRYSREFQGATAIEGEEAEEFWRRVRDFAPDFLSSNSGGAVARVSTTLAQVKDVAGKGTVLSRAGTGVSYLAFNRAQKAAKWIKEAGGRGWTAVIEWAAPDSRDSLDLWPAPGGDLETMKTVKRFFDPEDRLNKGRLYGRI